MELPNNGYEGDVDSQIMELPINGYEGDDDHTPVKRARSYVKTDVTTSDAKTVKRAKSDGYVDYDAVIKIDDDGYSDDYGYHAAPDPSVWKDGTLAATDRTLLVDLTEDSDENETTTTSPPRGTCRRRPSRADPQSRTCR